MNKFEASFLRYDDPGDNILQVSVVDSNGNPIPSKDIKVRLLMSKNAMLELGAELVTRVLQNKFDGKHWHLDPVEKGNAVRNMGVYLHPESPEVVLIHDEFGEVEGLFK